MTFYLEDGASSNNLDFDEKQTMMEIKTIIDSDSFLLVHDDVITLSFVESSEVVAIGDSGGTDVQGFVAIGIACFSAIAVVYSILTRNRKMKREDYFAFVNW